MHRARAPHLRLAEQEALAHAHPEGEQAVQLLRLLDAFRDEGGLDLLAQGGQGGDDLALDRVRVQVAYDRGRDLDVLRTELQD